MDLWRSVKMGVAVALCITWLVGCVQTKTTPGYARAGDHIVLGIGGIQRNAGGGAVLKKSDLTIVLTDSNASQYVLEPRVIFKSYLEYSAAMNTAIIDGSITTFGLTGMSPYDGGWFVIAPLTPPGDYNNPLPLAVGPASVSVTSPKLLNTGDAIEGNLANIPIEIISGTSPEDVDFVQQFLGYNANPKAFVVSPEDLSGVLEVGGAFMVIDYFDDTFFQNGQEPIVVSLDPSPYVNLSYNVVPNGNGTGSILVTLLNPAGFRTLATRTDNSSLLSDLSVKLVYFSSGTPTQAKANFSIDAQRSFYIDMNGAVMGGLSPVFAHVEDL